MERDPTNKEKVEKINRRLQAADGYNKIKFLPINKLFGENGTIKSEFFEKEITIRAKTCRDMLHYNKRGLRLIYDHCVQFININKPANKTTNQTTAVKSHHSKIMGGPELRDELVNEEDFNDPVSNTIGVALPEVEIKVGDTIIKCIVDSGSQASIISDEVYERV